MKKLIVLLLFTFLVIPAMAEVREFDPTKVLVDTERGVVLREPRQMDYDHVKDISKHNDSPRSLKELIFGKKGCGR